MKALGRWLMLVGSLRLAAVWFGFFDIWALRLAVFSNANKQAPLHCDLLSFIYALGHFLTEYLIYHTMAVANLTTVGFFAGTSIIWMLLQWEAHMSPPTASKKD
ncbi:unnamed protein product [Spirodela intermedia]|uniref:Uncharacterized protein n=1 Tax=Spirodela intermedia TaxID=51605 RepID=A0A7I8IZ76_SPIIN|nr:unnamed protein product [Spirodela intermedia]CAA6663012.1 unnamed protein product [Spirodela intermedia]